MPTERATITDLDVEEITATRRLDELRDAWQALWDRCPGATPFQSPAWLIPWRKCFTAGDLWSIALWADGRLVGLAPLFVYTGDAGERTLLLLGTGNTDYLDVLIEPRFATAGADRLLRHIDRHRARWDRCDLHQLRPASPLLDADAPSGWHDETTVQDACPVLDLPDRVDDRADAIPESFLDKLDYYERRTERAGTVRLERADADSLDTLYAALERLHAARWADQGLPGVLSDDATRAFHRRVTRRLLDCGWLRLYGLRLDDQIVASYYGFAAGNRHYYYLSGFDPEFSTLSLGHQIVYHAIEEAIREGNEAFDFLRGQEDYKYRWGAEDRMNRRRTIRPRKTDTG